MSVFPNWRTFAVPQRRLSTGCIPTGYQMILEAAAAQDVDFASFQDDFDLDINLGKGQAEPRNDFGSVATAVKQRYPWISFEQKSFGSGIEKTAFIDAMLVAQKPILISLAMKPFGGKGWHIMPVVDATTDQYLLLKIVEADGTPNTEWIRKAMLSEVHDGFPGGKEVGFLADLGKPGAS
ncbi:MAG: hypothetical protein C0467_23170 [Planctomycetaceae bacterium]|nr:hypothetical protein [Planctomycetaceae bacterium]